MKTLILSVWVFVIFKFAPETIDNNTSKFWIKSVALLNRLREPQGGAFYLFKIGRFYVRDPHKYPRKDVWLHSDWHPFCWRK